MYLKKIIMMKKGYVQVQCFCECILLSKPHRILKCLRKIRKAVGSNGTHAFFTRVSQMFKSC